MRLPAALLACAVSIALLATATPVRADVFGPISLVSVGAVLGATQSEQADYAEDAAISGNGQYVAFDGSFGGRTGVFRRDLLTGEIATVAEGDAKLPSISENGQYVSFTTTDRMDEENQTNEAPNVYVRDMETPDSQPCGPEWEQHHESCAFTLASAVNRSSQGLSYEYSGSDRSLEETRLGALASGRSALSANGRKVVFVTTAPSDLQGLEHEETPALQVVVRNLETKETNLVSVLAEPGTGMPTSKPVPTVTIAGGVYGAVYPGGSLISTFPDHSRGASISADGSTVAWMGQQIEKQAKVLSDERQMGATYTEPLWRRIDEGSDAPIRRVTGGSDPANSACAASGETQLPEVATLADPCQGPFETVAQNSREPGVWSLPPTDGGYLPQLSASGSTVAFLANAREIASGEEFGNIGESSDDLYVVNMSDGLTRVQALRRLTELAAGSSGSLSGLARTAEITSLSVSPDGSEVAFTTRRTVFPLGTLTDVSPLAAEAGINELFDVDLANDTLTRVTHGFAGEDQPSESPARGEDEGASSPSFSANDDVLAFASTASNLVYGDGNKASDAFVVERKLFSPTPTEQFVSSAPANPLLIPIWALGATALSRRDGSVLLYVNVPGAGSLHAAAQSTVLVRSPTKARGSARRKRAAAALVSRTVADTATQARAGGLIALPLKLSGPYAALAGEHGGVSATVNVYFAAPGHPELRQSLTVTFLRTIRPSHLPRAARTHARRSRAKGAHRR